MENSVLHNIVLDQGNQPAEAQTTTQAVPNPSDPRATWWLSIAQYLCNDLQSASLCDLVLQGRDGVVMAHGVVMAAVSPVIAAHLTLTTNKMVTFHLPEASHNTLTQLVHHVYQGSILLSRDSVEHFQAAANSIGMTQVNITIANSANFSQSGDTKVCHSESHGPDNLTSQEIVRIRCSNCGQGFADLHSYDKHVALETCLLRTTGQAVLNTKKDPLEFVYRICKIEPEWVRSITENSQPVSDIFSHQNADSAWDSKEMLPNVTDEVAGTIKNEMVEGQHIVPITAYSEDGLNRKKLSDKLTWRKELKHTKPFHCDRCLRSFTYKSSFEKHMTQACIRVRGPNSGAPTNLDSENKDLHISDKKTELSGSESDSEKSDQGLNSDSDYVESESDMDDAVTEEDQSDALSPAHQGRLGKWGKVVHALLSNEGTSSAKCPKCGILQTSIEDFEEHLKNSCDHSYGLKYVRATKLKLFEQYKNTDDVEKYVAMIKNDRRFRKSLKLEQYMKEESSNIRKGDNYNCNICGKEFVKRRNLRRHMYNYHKILRGFTCLKCNRKIRKKDECLSHIADHWVAEKFNLPFKPIFLKVNRCFICDQSLSTQEEIESHKQNCKVDQCVHICPICGLKFEGHYASASLKNHVRYVHDREPETCQICNAKVLTMTRHMKIVHSKDSRASTFVCSHCGKNFNRRDNLRVHERIHTGDKPFSCNLCGQQFRLKCLLKSHQAHHA